MEQSKVTRRRYARYSTDLPVTIHNEDGSFQGRITQISRGGCLIYPSLPSDLPAHVKVTFNLSDNLPPINCHGEIVYNIADKGTGVALIEISEAQQDSITEFFENHVSATKSSGS